MAGGFPTILSVGAEVRLPRIQKAPGTGGEAGWQSQEKIRKRKARAIGNSCNGAGAVTVKCEGWIGCDVRIGIENRVTVVGAESQLVGTPDPAHIVCCLSFSRIVVTGLDIHSVGFAPLIRRGFQPARDR